MFAIDDFKILDMIWNYTLLIIPFFVCKLMLLVWERKKQTTALNLIAIFALGLLWLLFIPNTAYVIMDIRHLAGVLPAAGLNVKLEKIWQIIFIFTYAAAGWLAFVYLVNQMKDFIKRAWGSRPAQVFIWLLMPLMSLGIMLGLLARLNSWDFLALPWLVIKTLALYFSQWIYFKNWLLFTIFLYLLYFFGNYVFKPKKL